MIKLTNRLTGLLIVFFFVAGVASLMSCGGSDGVAVILDSISRVSVDSSGLEGGSDSYSSSISSDGRYVVFESLATDLVAGDTNGSSDIFLHDTQTGATTRVSVDSSGIQGDGSSYDPSISSDGRYVAFHSYATDLVAGDTNGAYDVFVHDTETGETTRVSVDESGTQSNGSSYEASISSDGTYVAFHSSATNLVAVDTNARADIFVHDTQTGAMTLVSVHSSGTQGNGSSYEATISSDGRYVVFYSYAWNLVAGDSAAAQDIFVHDTQTGETTLVSVDSSGTQSDGSSYSSSISSDGRYVAFESFGTNLVAGDTNSASDVFVRDTVDNTTIRVSVDESGGESDDHSYNPSISSNGRYVVFNSYATNLVAGDTNGSTDIFLHDTQTGATTRVSVDESGTQSDGSSYEASISSNGRYVAFQSYATNLVAGDTNGISDIFRAPNE